MLLDRGVGAAFDRDAPEDANLNERHSALRAACLAFAGCLPRREVLEALAAVRVANDQREGAEDESSAAFLELAHLEDACDAAGTVPPYWQCATLRGFVAPPDSIFRVRVPDDEWYRSVTRAMDAADGLKEQGISAPTETAAVVAARTGKRRIDLEPLVEEIVHGGVRDGGLADGASHGPRPRQFYTAEELRCLKPYALLRLANRHRDVPAWKELAMRYGMEEGKTITLDAGRARGEGTAKYAHVTVTDLRAFLQGVSPEAQREVQLQARMASISAAKQTRKHQAKARGVGR